MLLDGTDRRALAILAWTAALLGLASALSSALGLRFLVEIEWPTDLYALTHVDRGNPVDVAIVGSSRAHFALSPSALDRCLGHALGRPTETIAANRMRASPYTMDIVARDFLQGRNRPSVLVVEVAPESLSDHHFDLDYTVTSTAALRDIPECLGASVGGGTQLQSCLRPLVRGVENSAFLLNRPWTDHRHIEWMALYHGGGQYCFGDDECESRNEAYDTESMARWDSRVATVVPHIRATRFADYSIGTGLPARHLVALLDRAAGHGQSVFVVNLPVSATYQEQIPAADYAAYLAWIAPTVAAHGGQLLDYNTPEWQGDRTRFLDPDHVNAHGSLLLSNALCGALAGRALH